jgi:cilia- and flagella-associated protein 52
VINGLTLHPDNEHILYPLGSSVVVRNVVQRTQTYLRGHDNDITVVAVSPSGKYIATGQKTFAGFQVAVRPYQGLLFLGEN